jgi:hypothetical protein
METDCVDNNTWRESERKETLVVPQSFTRVQKKTEKEYSVAHVVRR